MYGETFVHQLKHMHTSSGPSTADLLAIDTLSTSFLAIDSSDLALPVEDAEVSRPVEQRHRGSVEVLSPTSLRGADALALEAVFSGLVEHYD